jgi:type I restriction enzyme M protein
MNSIRTETETVIKRILPYLFRRGYAIEDIDFETPVKLTSRYSNGYVDLLIMAGKTRPQFLIEAKRISKVLTDKDRDQAIGYATTLKIPFVVVTNGADVRVYNTNTKQAMSWDGKRADKIPSKQALPKVMQQLKKSPDLSNVAIADASLPFRPGLPLRQLNSLFQRCHNTIRKIEKDEEHAFSDFSKILFLKLLEEKADTEPSFSLPYSYQFHQLAEYAEAQADQVKTAIESMLDQVKKSTPFGDVLSAPVYMENSKTYQSLVRELAKVSFSDSSLDSKGAAFEYFVRATLKGKSLGQYFTPRPLVRLMSAIVGRQKIVAELQSLGADGEVKVYDPACGTGGFLVYLLEESIGVLKLKLDSRQITAAAQKALKERLTKKTFFGSDANRGVAGAAKMNMIIAGDGHSNIQPEDSLAVNAKNWSASEASCNFIFSNPPFGTSEGGTLTTEDKQQFPINASKGQLLFLQKMVLATKAGGEICTVIDEGVLNTDMAAPLRAWILKQCKLRAVVHLPEETFKPNKINVKSSILLLERLEFSDEDGDQDSGESIRGFDFSKLLDEAESKWLLPKSGNAASGYNWSSFDVPVNEIRSDKATRYDLKYWEPTLRSRIKALLATGGQTIKNLNCIPTKRGKSPDADAYVDEADGFAFVVKPGSSMSKFGQLLVEGGDWIEKSLYDEYLEKATAEQTNYNLIQKGDVLVSSTGDGSLGKTCVYAESHPAIADGHVAIVRLDETIIDPHYLADYIREGFGAQQLERLYSGSTGQVELSPEMLDSVVVDMLSGTNAQKESSKALRKAEEIFLNSREKVDSDLDTARSTFSGLI